MTYLDFSGMEVFSIHFVHCHLRRLWSVVYDEGEASVTTFRLFIAWKRTLDHNSELGKCRAQSFFWYIVRNVSNVYSTLYMLNKLLLIPNEMRKKMKSTARVFHILRMFSTTKNSGLNITNYHDNVLQKKN